MAVKKTKSILLRPFLYEKDFNTTDKNALNGLLNSALFPAFSSDSETKVVFRLNDKSLITKNFKRLEYSGAEIFDFSSSAFDKDFSSTEFLVVSSVHYSACVLFDLKLAESENEVIFFSEFNSKKIQDILKIILPDEKFFPERRENKELNTAIMSLLKFCEEYSHELNVNEVEKNTLEVMTQNLKRDEFLAQKARYISHEIKNHLSIIDIYAKIVDKKCNGDETLKNASDMIFKSIHNVVNLLQDLKTFSEADLNVFELDKVVNEVVISTLEMAKLNNINLSASFENKFSVIIDKNKFQNVLLNLIKNAVEALNSTDRKEKYIEISAREKDDKISLTVANNGEKIDKKNAERLFEEGFTTKAEGSGLGLFICKQNLKEQFCELSLLKSTASMTVFEILMNKV